MNFLWSFSFSIDFSDTLWYNVYIKWKEEKFYDSTDSETYRAIHTYDLNLTCYILEDYEEKGE